MGTILDIGVLLVTGLAMAIVGMELNPGQLNALRTHKSRLIVLFGAQLIIVPGLALAVSRLLRLPPHISAALLLVAACPIGSMANFYTLLGRGNTSASITVNTVSCLTCSATMFLIYKIYGAALGREVGFAVPALPFSLQLIVLIALPVSAGIWLRHAKPDFVQRYLKLLFRLCFGGLAALLAGALISQAGPVAGEWRQSFGSAVLFIFLSLLAGLATGRILGFDRAERVAAAIVFPVRHVGVALAIAVAFVNRPEFALFATVYFLTQVVLLLAALGLYRWAFVKPPGVSDVWKFNPNLIGAHNPNRYGNQ